MDPSPGLLAITEPIAPTILGTVYIYPERGRAIHLRQLANGRVLVGERAQDEVTKDPTLAHARLLIREAKRSFPALAAVEVQDFSVEWRPMPRDGMPIVGPLPGLHSLYVAVAHGGVTMAPGLARFVAEEIVDGEPVDRLAPFRPDRFATHDADAYRSVEDVFSGASEMFIG
jgi:glycine/D-amino acid oxidase-like deaminating enzyme